MFMGFFVYFNYYVWLVTLGLKYVIEMGNFGSDWQKSEKFRKKIRKNLNKTIVKSDTRLRKHLNFAKWWSAFWNCYLTIRVERIQFEFIKKSV